MTSHRHFRRMILVGLLVLTQIGPLPALSATLSLGTARGVRGVEMSLDGGRSWLSLSGRSLPILDGSALRSTTGGALVDLSDGSRINLLPFTSVSLRDTGEATEVTLLSGRLSFRLPERTRVELRTATTWLRPVRTRPMVGEVLVAAGGTMGLRMAQGSIEIHEADGRAPVMVASLAPVFVPKPPPGARSLFTVDAPAAAPSGAVAVFSARGESIGYIGSDRQLVVHPGFTADLTQPFPPRLVQVAMARIPDKDRGEATPLFDVNGGGLGYLAGQTYYSQTMIAQAVAGSGPAVEKVAEGISTGASLAIIGGAVAVGGLGIAAVAGAFSSGGSKQAATAVSP